MAIRKIYTITEIVNRMIGRMTANTAVTDYTPGSNIRSIFETVAIFVEYLQFLIEGVYRSFYVDSAAGDDLDSRVRDFGMARKAAKRATGKIKFQRNDPATSTFTVAAGVEVSTQPDVFGSTISYSLDNDVTFPSGAVEAIGDITCNIAGIDGNVASGKITNITSAIPGIDAVINPYALTDGASQESDSQLRKRVPVFLNGLKRANEDAIKSAILAIEGITLVRLQENNPNQGYITVYVANESGKLSQDQLDAVKVAAEETAAFGIQANVVEPSIQYITIELTAELDTDNYNEDILLYDMKSLIDEYIRTNPEFEVQRYNIILFATIPGVINIKDVKINGVADDYKANGFVVIRLADKETSITINVEPNE